MADRRASGISMALPPRPTGSASGGSPPPPLSATSINARRASAGFGGARSPSVVSAHGEHLNTSSLPMDGNASVMSQTAAPIHYGTHGSASTNPVTSASRDDPVNVSTNSLLTPAINTARGAGPASSSHNLSTTTSAKESSAPYHTGISSNKHAYDQPEAATARNAALEAATAKAVSGVTLSPQEKALIPGTTNTSFSPIANWPETLHERVLRARLVISDLFDTEYSRSNYDRGGGSGLPKRPQSSSSAMNVSALPPLSGLNASANEGDLLNTSVAGQQQVVPNSLSVAQNKAHMKLLRSKVVHILHQLADSMRVDEAVAEELEAVMRNSNVTQALIAKGAAGGGGGGTNSPNKSGARPISSASGRGLSGLQTGAGGSSSNGSTPLHRAYGARGTAAGNAAANAATAAALVNVDPSSRHELIVANMRVRLSEKLREIEAMKAFCTRKDAAIDNIRNALLQDVVNLKKENIELQTQNQNLQSMLGQQGKAARERGDGAFGGGMGGGGGALMTNTSFALNATAGGGGLGSGMTATLSSAAAPQTFMTATPSTQSLGLPSTAAAIISPQHTKMLQEHAARDYLTVFDYLKLFEGDDPDPERQEGGALRIAERHHREVVQRLNWDNNNLLLLKEREIHLLRREIEHLSEEVKTAANKQYQPTNTYVLYRMALLKATKRGKGPCMNEAAAMSMARQLAANSLVMEKASTTAAAAADKDANSKEGSIKESGRKVSDSSMSGTPQASALDTSAAGAGDESMTDPQAASTSLADAAWESTRPINPLDLPPGITPEDVGPRTGEQFEADLAFLIRELDKRMEENNKLTTQIEKESLEHAARTAADRANYVREQQAAQELTAQLEERETECAQLHETVAALQGALADATNATPKDDKSQAQRAAEMEAVLRLNVELQSETIPALTKERDEHASKAHHFDLQVKQLKMQLAELGEGLTSDNDANEEPKTPADGGRDLTTMVKNNAIMTKQIARLEGEAKAASQKLDEERSKVTALEAEIAELRTDMAMKNRTNSEVSLVRRRSSLGRMSEAGNGPAAMTAATDKATLLVHISELDDTIMLLEEERKASDEESKRLHQRIEKLESHLRMATEMANSAEKSRQAGLDGAEQQTAVLQAELQKRIFSLQEENTELANDRMGLAQKSETLESKNHDLANEVQLLKTQLMLEKNKSALAGGKSHCSTTSKGGKSRSSDASSGGGGRAGESNIDTAGAVNTTSSSGVRTRVSSAGAGPRTAHDLMSESASVVPTPRDDVLSELSSFGAASASKGQGGKGSTTTTTKRSSVVRIGGTADQSSPSRSKADVSVTSKSTVTKGAVADGKKQGGAAATAASAGGGKASTTSGKRGSLGKASNASSKGKRSGSKTAGGGADDDDEVRTAAGSDGDEGSDNDGELLSGVLSETSTNAVSPTHASLGLSRPTSASLASRGGNATEATAPNGTIAKNAAPIATATLDASGGGASGNKSSNKTTGALPKGAISKGRVGGGGATNFASGADLLGGLPPPRAASALSAPYGVRPVTPSEAAIGSANVSRPGSAGRAAGPTVEESNKSVLGMREGDLRATKDKHHGRTPTSTAMQPYNGFAPMAAYDINRSSTPQGGSKPPQTPPRHAAAVSAATSPLPSSMLPASSAQMKALAVATITIGTQTDDLQPHEMAVSISDASSPNGQRLSVSVGTKGLPPVVGRRGSTASDASHRTTTYPPQQPVPGGAAGLPSNKSVNVSAASAGAPSTGGQHHIPLPNMETDLHPRMAVASRFTMLHHKNNSLGVYGHTTDGDAHNTLMMLTPDEEAEVLAGNGNVFAPSEVLQKYWAMQWVQQHSDQCERYLVDLRVRRGQPVGMLAVNRSGVNTSHASTVGGGVSPTLSSLSPPRRAGSPADDSGRVSVADAGRREKDPRVAGRYGWLAPDGALASSAGGKKGPSAATAEAPLPPSLIAVLPPNGNATMVLSPVDSMATARPMPQQQQPQQRAEVAGRPLAGVISDVEHRSGIAPPSPVLQARKEAPQTASPPRRAPSPDSEGYAIAATGTMRSDSPQQKQQPKRAATADASMPNWRTTVRNAEIAETKAQAQLEEELRRATRDRQVRQLALAAGKPPPGSLRSLTNNWADGASDGCGGNDSASLLSSALTAVGGIPSKAPVRLRDEVRRTGGDGGGDLADGGDAAGSATAIPFRGALGATPNAARTSPLRVGGVSPIRVRPTTADVSDVANNIAAMRPAAAPSSSSNVVPAMLPTHHLPPSHAANNTLDIRALASEVYQVTQKLPEDVAHERKIIAAAATRKVGGAAGWSGGADPMAAARKSGEQAASTRGVREKVQAQINVAKFMQAFPNLQPLPKQSPNSQAPVKPKR